MTLSCEIPTDFCVHSTNNVFFCDKCQIERQIININNLLLHAQEGIEKCFERIEKLEKSLNLTDKNSIHILGKINKLEQSSPGKKPHKCPVCDGTLRNMVDPNKQLSFGEKVLLKRDSNGIPYFDCLICNSEGIVWG